MKRIARIITVITIVMNAWVMAAQSNNISENQDVTPEAPENTQTEIEIEVENKFIQEAVNNGEIEAKKCKKGCKKACCASKASNEKTTENKVACKPGCEKPCCASVDSDKKLKSCCKDKKSCKKSKSGTAAACNSKKKKCKKSCKKEGVS